MNRMIRIALAGWIAVLAVSCGKGDEVQTTITEDQAKARIEEYVRQALAVLPSEARLELQSAASSVPCDDPTDNGPRGRVTVGNTYWVRGLSSERNSQYLDSMISWWKQHDFSVLDDKRPASNYVRVESKRDGFRIAFSDNPRGELLLGADSPCVWPDGRPGG
jgi:hypothetical protein